MLFIILGDGLTFPTRINSANIEATYQSTGQRPPLVMASPAANAVRGRSKDISYIDEDPTQPHHHNGVKHTEVILDTDERIQVKVSKLPKHDLMHHWRQAFSVTIYLLHITIHDICNRPPSYNYSVKRTYKLVT